jgi:hypothetical protein
MGIKSIILRSDPHQRAGTPDQSVISKKKTFLREKNVASLQALCGICGKTVTAFTVLSDGELKSLLDRNEEIMVLHVFADGSGNRLDHRWNLGGEEKRNLRKLIDIMVRDNKQRGQA